MGAHRALLHTLVRRVEQEGAEQGHTGAVVQHRQVSLRELEGRWALLQQLPRSVQEEQEHGSLHEDKTRVMEGCQRSEASGPGYSAATWTAVEWPLWALHALGSTFQVTAIPNCVPSPETNMLD